MAIAAGKRVFVIGDHPDFGTWQHHPQVEKFPSIATALNALRDEFGSHETVLDERQPGLRVANERQVGEKDIEGAPQTAEAAPVEGDDDARAKGCPPASPEDRPHRQHSGKEDAEGHLRAETRDPEPAGDLVRPLNLTEHEWRVLEMAAGDRPGEQRGAWVSACLEFLVERGLLSRGPKHIITLKGLAALAARANAGGRHG
jgi:hypothetical protein